MKTLRKWNYETHQYEPYDIPDDWNCKLYTENFDEIVNCPHCGKALPFGATYTSQEIHSWMGMGYGICAECAEKEYQRRKEADGL